MLLSMPLHAITEVYGEAGLRDRFNLEIARLPDGDRRQLEDALALASRLHADDRRVREPYLNHLLRVAIRIVGYYRIQDVDVLTAALLHDAVEDHPAELAELPSDLSHQELTDSAVAALAKRYSPRVAELVRSVTNPEYDPHRDRNEQYRTHVAASLEQDPWARVIKVSDFTDNGLGVIHTTDDKARSSAMKYRPLVPKLRELVGRADTPLSLAAKDHILDQLDLAEERFAAILDG
ncbi:HD domain-containing protein [Couchioplanes caeruleus]|uniref:Phosphohydrolase n=2 Tax=Couchioplanes caeruleus TaxID=56438 RepID=A0A1K0GS02_9ACTN|nr:HD domain-containing protein [Couchioplanes caeruleus]OJF12051.1 phosphohydrolase [Couchioplanes caeruleus subsp. caeruleus]ROP29743.1 HD domain-containing protein [Couchioplanes caeruleus]